MADPPDPAAERLRRRRGRTQAVLAALLLLAFLLYALTLARLS